MQDKPNTKSHKGFETSSKPTLRIKVSHALPKPPAQMLPCAMMVY
jgi:hypothetical protein